MGPDSVHDSVHEAKVINGVLGALLGGFLGAAIISDPDGAPKGYLPITILFAVAGGVAGYVTTGRKSAPD